MLASAEQRVSFESMFDDDDDVDLPATWGAPEDLLVVEDDGEPEFLGALLPGVGGIVNAGAKAVSKLFSPGRPKTVTTRPAVNHAAGLRGRQTGSVLTPGGAVSVRMGTAYITPQELQHALEGVRRDINALQTATKLSDQQNSKAIANLSKTTATAIAGESSKRVAELKRIETSLTQKIDDARQFALFSMILGDDGSGGGAGGGDDDMMLPLLMMSGGLGGSGSGSGSNNDMLMILALSGRL